MRRAAAIGLSLALMATAGAASAGEVFIGGFAHDVGEGFSGTPHEDGTEDFQVGFRTHQFESLWFLLKPMFYAKGQFNTDDRTNFYTVGIEWRKHLFQTHFYGDFGVGGSYVAGFNTYPNDFQSGDTLPANATPAQVQQFQNDQHVYNKFKALGSDYVFNPNFSLGYDLTREISAEVSWEHYSNAGFGGRNPGMDNYGARLVYHFGGPF